MLEIGMTFFPLFEDPADLFNRKLNFYHLNDYLFRQDLNNDGFD
jgi:hypothetical protein